MLRTLATVLALTFTLVPASARAGVWTNGNGTFSWSSAGNWNPVGVPCGPGGIAQFFPGPSVLSAADLPCTLNRLEFAGSGWNVGGGGPISMAGPGAYILAEGTTLVSTPMSFDASTTVYADGFQLKFNGTISGAGPITISGSAGASEVRFVEFGPGSTSPVTVSASAKLTSEVLNGNNALTILAGGTVNAIGSNWGSLSGVGTMDAIGGLLVGNLGSSLFSGSLTVSGTLTKVGNGTLQLSGNNTFTNASINIAGNPATSTLHFGNGTSGNFPAGVDVTNDATLVINVPGTASIGALTGSGNLVVLSGIVNQAGPWTYSGNTTVGSTNLTTTSLVTSGNVALNSTAWTAGSSSIGSLSGFGSVNLTGTLQVGSNGSDTTFGGLFFNGGGQFHKVGTGTLTLTGANMPAPTTVIAGTLRLANTSFGSSTTVNSGATLAGSGTLDNVQLAPGATFAPMDFQAVSINDVGATWSFAIDGVSPGLFGHVRVNQVPTLAATLTLTGSLVPFVGSSFMIVEKLSPGPLPSTFQGLPEGAVIQFNGVPLRITYTGGDGNDVVLSVAIYLVTPVTALNGTIAPLAPQPIAHGASAQFTITPNVGYAVTVGGSCPAGSFSGNLYTTGPITAACTVNPTFAVAQYTVTPSAGLGGSISPNSAQLVNHNATPAFTITTNAGYVATIGGSCGGNLVGTTYTTSPVIANCTVSVTFALVNVYNVVLEGYQQVGPYVETTATGSGTVTFNTVTKKLKLNLTYTGAFPNAAHIHGPALRGANAPVLITLSTAIPNAMTDEVTLDAAQEAMLLAGQLYVNLHSLNYPNGQLRAQIDNLGARVRYMLTGTAPVNGIIQGGTEAGNNLFHCPTSCSMSVPEGSAVRLATIGDTAGYVGQWGGACSGTESGEHCEFTMDADKAVSATFVDIGVDLSSTLTAAPNPAPVGQAVTFTMTVSNAGPITANNVGADVELPSGLTFVSAGTGCVDFTFSGTTFVGCEAGNLAAGANAQFTFVLRPTATGTFQVTTDVYSNNPDYNSGNESATVNLVVNPGARLGNISTRMQVLTGNDVLIGGFVIGGSTNKRVAIIATGPSLVPFGIPNALANPTLRLVRSSDQAVLATSDDWQSAANQADLTAAGLAPSNALEAAILIDLAPGAYTAIVEGAGGVTGVSVIGVYEVDHPESPLVNISTRGRVLTGNDVMIGGFVVNGAAPKTLAIVATGPSLAPFGIANPLANPTITVVRSSDQVVVASNDDWQTDANSAQLQAKGFAPSNALESGLLITLPVGAYTVIVQGVGGGTGVAVIGVYAVD